MKTKNAPVFDVARFEQIVASALHHARSMALPLNKTLRAQPGYVLGVTSAVPGEGKSTLSRALGEVLATDFAHQVLLTDLHTERPAVHTVAGSTRRGLSDWARDECVLDEVLISQAGWTALACGTGAPTARDLLHTITRHGALNRLRERFPVIVLDLPPLANGAGAALAQACDGVVLVVQAGKTPADVVKAALPLLRDVHVHGVVLNRQRMATPRVLRHLWA